MLSRGCSLKLNLRLLSRPLSTKTGIQIRKRENIPDILSKLKERGLLYQTTSPSTIGNFFKSQNNLGIYCGYDPTASSLHVGNLLTIVTLVHFLLYQHRVYAVLGGATGIIGDPSFRKSQRTSIQNEQFYKNVHSIETQLLTVFKNAISSAQKYESNLQTGQLQILDNYEWFKNITFIEFQRDISCHFNLHRMMDRDSMQNRLKGGKEGSGLTFSELGYQVMQAYDFLWLNQNMNVNIQVGGSDQYGNITAGLDLIQSIQAKPVFGLTVPLLTTKKGEKFGKSQGNALWLDPGLTSPIDLYQYFVNIPHYDLEKLLLLFTFMPKHEIQIITRRHLQNPGTELAIANKILAKEVTELIHGPYEAARAEMASNIIHYGVKADAARLLEIFCDRSTTLSTHEILGQSLKSLVSNIFSISKTEAVHRIKSSNIALNGSKIVDPSKTIDTSDLVQSKVLILKSGKSIFHVVQVKN